MTWLWGLLPAAALGESRSSATAARTRPAELPGIRPRLPARPAAPAAPAARIASAHPASADKQTPPAKRGEAVHVRPRHGEPERRRGHRAFPVPAPIQQTGGSKDKAAGPPPLVARAVTLVAPAQGERLLFRPFDSRGRPQPEARRALTHLLRCPHTGAERTVDARLVPVLYRMGQHFGRSVVIFSGYRPPQLSTRPGSRHLRAAAIDFHIPGVRNEAIVRWLQREVHPAGVGYYPDGVHVHLDVDRQADAFWIEHGSDTLPLAERLRRHGRPDRS